VLPIDIPAIAAYAQIVVINVVLSGDNVVVISMVAAALVPALRTKAIVAGIAAATLIRIVFSLIATQLLAVAGLQLAGGLLLLWVCWKLMLELRQAHAGNDGPGGSAEPARKTLGAAIVQIVVADVSMSLDNVLAVAGAARNNIPALVFGLILSVALMGLAASLVARLLARQRWIGWLGLAIIVYVAFNMIYVGSTTMAAGH
jgi:YjbE family integral membrane protein